MRKSVWLFLTAITVATVSLAVACGDDDDSPPTPGVDAGKDVTVTPPPDTGPPKPLPDTGPPPDSGVDAGCTFAGFVIKLVNTQTTQSAIPSADLGDSCKPATSQDEFKSLFP